MSLFIPTLTSDPGLQQAFLLTGFVGSIVCKACRWLHLEIKLDPSRVESIYSGGKKLWDTLKKCLLKPNDYHEVYPTITNNKIHLCTSCTVDVLKGGDCTKT